jgi:glycosyltransferase involved in cell wall biosynthesis
VQRIDELRILLASDHYPPFIGGAHRQTQLLAHRLHARGHDITVAVPRQPALAAVEDERGVPVYRVPQLRSLVSRPGRRDRQRHQPPFPDPLTVWSLRRIIRRTRPEVVHSYGWITLSLAAALLGNDTPLLMSARDYGNFCATRTLVRDNTPCSGPAIGKCLACAGRYYGVPKGWVATTGVALGRPLLRRKVSALHCISEYVRDAMHEHVFGDQSAQILEAVIPSFAADDDKPVDDPSLHRYLDQLPADPFILFVGAFRKVKGLDTLFSAYDRLTVRPPLVLIGTHERDSPTRFPQDATVLTDFPHPAVLAAWRRALFGVTPSLWPEPLGAVVFEGMSCGKAVIGTSPGGHEEMIIDGETGRLVPPGDAEALVHAMEELIRDDELRERYGRAALHRSELFSADVVVPKFEQLYREIVARRPRTLG